MSNDLKSIPPDQHINYQYQYRKCGKAACRTCRNGRGHGPYWYAFWREGSHVRSKYVGKKHPTLSGESRVRRFPEFEVVDDIGVAHRRKRIM